MKRLQETLCKLYQKILSQVEGLLSYVIKILKQIATYFLCFLKNTMGPYYFKNAHFPMDFNGWEMDTKITNYISHI